MHIEALVAHGIDVDMVVCDTSSLDLGLPSVRVIDGDLARPNGLAHDSAKLAQALSHLLG
jgi:hypothetical protein